MVTIDNKAITPSP